VLPVTIRLHDGPLAGTVLEAVPYRYTMVEAVQDTPRGLVFRAYAIGAAAGGTAVAIYRPMLDRPVPGWGPKKTY
jgi:hypothetical protein